MQDVAHVPPDNQWFEAMTTSRKGLTVVEVMLLAAVPLICAALLLPMLARPTNCGGNSAALAACRDIALSFRVIALEHGDRPVLMASLTPEEKENFRHVAGLSWLPGSRILVAQGPIVVRERPPKEILAVCDHPFDNVPRRFVGKSPPTHAVAYSDGSTGLISIEEFRRADFSGFVDVTTIAPKNPEPNGATNGSQPFRSETGSASSAAGSRH